MLNTLEFESFSFCIQKVILGGGGAAVLSLSLFNLTIQSSSGRKKDKIVNEHLCNPSCKPGVP